MKQLLILSGKGGTGKTTIAGAFIKIASAKAYADCDVDAPNLHLVRNPAVSARLRDFYGMGKAKVNTDSCMLCDLCRQNCSFEAIKVNNGQYFIDSYSCEGCGVCEAICPAGAIVIQPVVAGDLMLFKDNEIFSTAKLRMGNGTSGKLVSEVKKQLNQEAVDVDLAIIDGSPGIGCPVIASLNGVDMVLIVAEPSLSGISDMERIIITAEKFQMKIGVCVNKYDTNKELTQQIEAYCHDQGLPFLGKIPFDTAAVKAINNGQSIVEMDCPAGRAVINIFDKVLLLMSSTEAWKGQFKKVSQLTLKHKGEKK